MRYWTWLEIREKVERDLDLEEETFIQPEELLAYANEAIDEAEAEIHSLYEDYFLAKVPLTFVQATDSYDMPSDIYGDKIRKIFYQNGSRVYEITRLTEEKKLSVYHLAQAFPGSSTSCLEYFLENSVAGSPQIVFVPVPEESGAYGTIWYLRNANRLVSDTDICDIPEFVEFVMQYMKFRCYEKEGHPNLPLAITVLESHRKQMTSTLSQRVADGENKIEADFSYYTEQV